MSVSFTQVQAAVQNLTPTGGASGPLTLQVLHKTEALLSKLLAFDQSKPVSVEVLKATPNGRAEVIAGGLKLDVKASIPLKAGEVFQLKPEPVGSSFRFVQAPLNAADGAAGSVKTAVSGQNGLAQTAKGPIPTGVASATQGAVNAKLPTLNTGVVQANVTQGGVGGATTASGSVTTQQSQIATSPQSGAGRTPAAGSGSGINPQVTASALIKLAAETLPNGLQTGALARGQAHIQTSLQPGIQAGQNAGLSAGLSSGLQGAATAGQIGAAGRRGDERGADFKSAVKGNDGAGGRGLPLPVNAVEKVTAEQVTAKYTQFTSQPVEEVQELQGRQAQKADLTIELPLGGDAKPLMVQLQIGRDEAGPETGDERDAYALRFSLETEETGPVHASVGLPFVQKEKEGAQGHAAHFRVTIWAEQALFADMLEAERDLLIDRFAATGLDLSRLQIRRGRPLSMQYRDSVSTGAMPGHDIHLDSEI